MMNLDDFPNLVTICPGMISDEKLREFKLFWLQHNQISPHKFPIAQPNLTAWVELFELWDEGLLPQQFGV